MNSFLYRTLFMFIVTFLNISGKSSHGSLKESPLLKVTTLVGRRVLLPCDITPPDPADRPILVLFYQGSIRTPVFSLDARGESLSTGSPRSEPSIIGDRAHFDLDGPKQGLILKPVKEKDNALYRCRVDFSSSPTRNSRINLQVVVPPRLITISSANNNRKELYKPFPVGEKLVLQCLVEGGFPLPHVIWRKNNIVLDDLIDEQTKQYSINNLYLDSLTREDLGQIFVCQAQNSNLTKPMISSLKIDMKFPPVEVNISSSTDIIVEEKEFMLICETKGSRPPAEITWWKNEIQIKMSTPKIITSTSLSRSTIIIVPNKSDNGAIIVCRAFNPLIPAHAIESTMRLIVNYAPRLKLAVGTALSLNNVKEGIDFYFECRVEAQPVSNNIQWYYNNDHLEHDVEKGIILSNQSLVLQKISRNFTGEYQCFASNQQGSTTSKTISLKVKYRPLCQTPEPSIYGVEIGEKSSLHCNVVSHPSPIEYKWSFNSSSEIIGTNSLEGENNKTVVYNPKRDSDFGSVLCWAKNEVGWQSVPCFIHVTHSSIPDPVTNCNFNLTSYTASIYCVPGWNGGLEQTFSLELQSKRSQSSNTIISDPRALASRSSAQLPYFHLHNLKPDWNYFVSVLAVNKKGFSIAKKFTFTTPPDNMQVVSDKSSAPESSAWTTAVIISGTAVSVLLLATAAFVTVKSRKRCTRLRVEEKQKGQTRSLLRKSKRTNNTAEEQSV